MNIRFSAILKPVAYDLKGNQLTLDPNPAKYLGQLVQATHNAGEKFYPIQSGVAINHGRSGQFELDYGSNRDYVVTGADVDVLNAKRMQNPLSQLSGPMLRDLVQKWRLLKEQVVTLTKKDEPETFGYREIDPEIEAKKPVNQVQSALNQLMDEITRVHFQNDIKLENEFLTENQGRIEAAYFLNGQQVDKAVIDGLKPMLKAE